MSSSNSVNMGPLGTYNVIPTYSAFFNKVSGSSGVENFSNKGWDLH